MIFTKKGVILEGLSMVMLFLLIVSCTSVEKHEATKPGDAPAFYLAGHRGARGLMPENTIPAMKKGIEVGANTLEMDLQVTADGKVVLNHDNTLNPLYVSKPDGGDIPQLPDHKRINNSYIPENQQDKYTIYKMTYKEIRKYIVGEKYFPDFPEQTRIKTYMPVLTEVIDSIEQFTKEQHYAPVYYMPEIKSGPDFYGSMQPEPEAFVRTVMNKLEPYLEDIGERLIIQSSDLKPLQILHRDYPDIKIALLPHQRNIAIEQRIEQLGFKPDFFLPRYKVVTPELIEKCHSMGMKVVPWTPDNSKSMRDLYKMGVDGIITNYPDRLHRVINSM